VKFATSLFLEIPSRNFPVLRGDVGRTGDVGRKLGEVGKTPLMADVKGNRVIICHNDIL